MRNEKWWCAGGTSSYWLVFPSCIGGCGCTCCFSATTTPLCDALFTWVVDTAAFELALTLFGMVEPLELSFFCGASSVRNFQPRKCCC